MKSLIFWVEMLGSLVVDHHVLVEDIICIFRVRKINLMYCSSDLLLTVISAKAK
jgi:hypothetical protein